MLAFITRQYDGCQLDIETAIVGLSRPAYELNVAHLRAVAEKG